MIDAVTITSKWALNATLGPVFDTTVIPLVGGYEDRNQNWPVALWRYEIELKNRSMEEMDEFMRHMLGRRGAYRAFPLRDPLDNSLADELIATGDGETVEFEIGKTYPDTVNPYFRTISIVENLVVKVDSVEQVLDTDYANEGGWVAFALPPDEGAEVTVSCDFYIPVRYEDDFYPVILHTPPGMAGAYASTDRIVLKEVHVAKPAIVAPDPPDEEVPTLPDGALLLSGDQQSGTDALALSGDEQSGSDVLQTSIPA